MVVDKGESDMPLSFPTPDDYGGSIQAALDACGTVYLDDVYRITEQLVIPAVGGLIGAPGSGLVMGAANGEFDNQNPGAVYDSNACGIYAGAGSNARLEGFSITREARDDAFLIAVGTRGRERVEIDRLDVSGFGSCAAGYISVNSATRGGYISRCQVRDCTSDFTGVTGQQLTGIAVDGERVSDANGPVSTDGLSIVRNNISNILMGPNLLAANSYQQQTDGINACQATKLLIEGNTISDVGEGIDCFSSWSRIGLNTLFNCHEYGIKLVHGAGHNVIPSNVISFAGRAGLICAGSHVANVSSNTFIGNRILSVGWFGYTSIGSAIMTDGSTAVYTPQANRFMLNVVTNPGRHVVDFSAGDGNYAFRNPSSNSPSVSYGNGDPAHGTIIE